MELVFGIFNIVSKAVEYTFSPIQNQMKYLTGHENNVQNLKTQVERLNDARGRVQHDVDAAKRNGEEIENDVDKWLTNVNEKITEEVEKVMQDEEKAKKKCFVGLCPNLWARYKHSVKAEAEAKAVAELLEQGKFDRVSHRVALQGITAAAVKGFETFESRTLVLDGIMEALKDDGISVIGVHGMGGVGKTTLVKEVARQVKEGKLFDSVVIATVTLTLDLKDIQNQIAELLDLRFEEQSMVGRALRLQERLKKEKKILVVLDDIWATLDLEKVGIPCGDEHVGCKILLTSRELNVLSSGMNSEKNFTIGLLNEEETWTLFKKMAGGDVVESHDLQPIAVEIAKKCAGLPIAIATVARALRNKKLFEWKNALLELKRPSSTNLEGVATDVYSAIELSYNHLESEEVKFTFLLCSLLGHNGLIEELLRYIIGKDLFHGRGIRSIEEARNRVLTLVSKLKSSCLLLDSYNDERFDIHDIVWDVAISIASRDHRMFVLRSIDELKEWPHNEIMNNPSAISLLNPRIIGELKLPDEMECPHLSFFSMDINLPFFSVGINDSVQIPANFFRGTERLQVLNLPGMHFQSLPVSINLLTNLRTLRLNGCRLEDITIVGKLENLKVLSLARSNIKALPKEIAQLTQLSLLDLNDCNKLKFIPPDVLSSLSKLEELYMENSFLRWEDGALGNRRRNASLDELKHLTHLTTLYADIPDAQIIPKHLFTQALERYRILIGHVEEDEYHRFKNEYLRTLRVQLDTSMDDGVKILLKKSEDLYLAPLRGMRNVFGELLDNGEDFSDLKGLHIKDGLEVQYIATENDKFPHLQSMTLEGLPQLISFCSEENRCSSSHQKEVAMSAKRLPLFNKQLVFPQLKSLIIKGCGKLQHLFSPSIARNLVHLTHFEIEDCTRLREVISKDEIEQEDKVVICFPQLSSVKLSKLRNLVNFCGGNYNIEFPALKVLELHDCPVLKGFINEPEMEETLFNKKVALPSLESLRISHLKIVKMIFRNQLLAAGSFSKLKEMNVGGCDKLLTIFPANLIGVLTFQNLRRVYVHNCMTLKNIFPVSIAKDLRVEDVKVSDCGVAEIVSAGEVLEEPIEFGFAHVSSLALRNLRELKCFYPGQHTIVWPMLKKLEISDYPTLLKILGIQEAVCPYLYSLELSSVNIQMMWDHQQPPSSSLFHLTVKGCHNLKYLFLSFMLKHFVLLGSLHICDCKIMEEVIFMDGSREDERLRPMLFPRLYSLDLKDLPKLSRFCYENYIEFSYLMFLTLENCSLLKTFLSKEAENAQGNKVEVSALFNEKVALPLLHTLTIKSMPNCRKIWADQITVNSFLKLSTIEIKSCERLLYIFPLNMMERLEELSWLQIVDCDSLEEIVEPQAIIANQSHVDASTQSIVEQTVTKFVFPRVTYLRFEKLPKLKSFYSMIHATEWPLLKEMKVIECLNVQIFASGCPGLLGATHVASQAEISNRQPLFWVNEVTFPILEALTVMHGQVLSTECFRKLKVLELICVPEKSTALPRCFFHSLPNLEIKLVLKDASLCQIFQFEGLSNDERYASALTRLSALRLSKLPELTHLWKEEFQPREALCGLKILEVQDSGKLKTLAKYLVCFNNLTTLKVSGCHGFINLISCSAAKSLTQLERMSIIDCEKIKEIVDYDADEILEGAIVFSELRYMELSRLPSLASFCLGDHSFEFPILREVIVEECPKMKMFCQGDLSTPTLPRVQLTRHIYIKKRQSAVGRQP